MAPRLELQALFKELLGTNNVYFQPPSTVKMSYDCIVYSREDIDTIFADNISYRNKTKYQVTYISTDPDSDMVGKIKELPMCSYDRFYAAENLNHDVFTLFF